MLRNKLFAVRFSPIKPIKKRKIERKAYLLLLDLKIFEVPEVLKLTIITVKKLKRTMMLAKKTISLSSMRPLDIVSKWVKKLKEAIMSTIEVGAKVLKIPKINSSPLKKKRMFAKKERTSAIT